MKAENRVNRQTIAMLEAEIDELRARLARYENVPSPEPVRERRRPMIR